MIAELFVFAVFLIVYRYYRKWANNVKYFQDRNLKYVSVLHAIRNLFNTFTGKKDFAQIIEQSRNLYPEDTILGGFDLSGLDWSGSSYIVRDPETFKRFSIKEFEHFEDHRFEFDEQLDPILANALIVLRGEKWHQTRATLSPAFTGAKMRSMFELVSDCAVECVQHVSKQADAGKQINVEVKDFFSRYTNDVIATCAFGIKVNSFADPNNEFYLNGGKLASPPLSRVILNLMAPKLIKVFKLSVIDRTVSDLFKNMILDTMEIRQKNHIYRPDMINMLMDLRKGNQINSTEQTSETITDGFATVEESKAIKSIQKRQWNDDEITAQCFIFFQAGFEVTSQALTFTAYELVANPDVQQKLYEEIAAMNEKLNGQRISYEMIQKMKYLDQVISEALRKWPPVVQLDRLCVKDYVYDDGKRKFLIEKGSNIVYSVFATHRDPKYFPNPIKFDPERFSDENKHHIVAGSYTPFGSGPRNCIGSRFGLMELKAILYYLLLNFSFEANDKSELPLRFNLTGVKFHLELKPRKTK